MTGPVELRCHDGRLLSGNLWRAPAPKGASVVITGATGVRARYYHYYARFLADSGYDVLTFDYRGIGASRQGALTSLRASWRDWGEQDIDAALSYMTRIRPDQPVRVVGHSIGGVLPGLAPSGSRIERMLTVGAQYAYWRDYRRDKRLDLIWKWHVVMPVLTALYGYFPGKALGWIEDLPAGVANEWSFRRHRLELNYPEADRQGIRNRFNQVTAPILAVAVSDDELAPAAAIRRALQYYGSSSTAIARVTPEGGQTIGHFGFFHDHHRDCLWAQSLRWLSDGTIPWQRAD